MESKEKTPLTTSLILLLSITCGVVVANMYYIQPIGTKVAASLSVSTSVSRDIDNVDPVGLLH